MIIANFIGRALIHNCMNTVSDGKLQIPLQTLIDCNTLLFMCRGHGEPETWHQRPVWTGEVPVFTIR